jgi:AcrR family transcriptional regulator
MASATGNRSGRPRVDRRTRAARAEGRDGREELLAAATKVFARRGFQQASVDEIAAEAGFSKGAVYWHFANKDELFFALLEERIDQPMREMIALLRSAPAEHDMAPEANRSFAEMLGGEREMMLLEQEYWSRAVRDPKLAKRYLERQRQIRAELGRALKVRAENLGAPTLERSDEELATVFLAVIGGLARDSLVDPDSVPEYLLGDAFATIYAGMVARAQPKEG